MKGLILINAYPNGEKFIRQAERIAQEFRARSIEIDVLRNGTFPVGVSEDGTPYALLSKEYAFIIYLDKDKYLGKILEKCGYRLFNSSQSVEICDDKMLTALALKNAGVSIPECIPAPLCYTPNAVADGEFLNKVAEKLHFPLVVKKSYGSFGTGVQLAENMADLTRISNDFLHIPHFYQRYVAESAGRDIRVIVVGGKALAAMERVAQNGEFRSNIELGGTGRNIVLTPQVAETAERAAKALHLEYCGVDILEEKGGTLVCEVNSNAFFEGFESATGVNVAASYAQYILSVL